LTQEEKDELDEIAVLEGPTAHLEALFELKAKKQEEAKTANDKAFWDYYNTNMKDLNDHHPDYEDIKEDVYNLLIDDGIPEKTARAVADYPGTEDQFAINHIISRVRTTKTVISEKSEIEALREELRLLKEGKKGSNKQLLDSIERASNKPPTITSSSVRTKPSKSKKIDLDGDEESYEELSSMNFVDED